MVISREVKIGTVALLTIIVFIWLYSFLRGENLLTRTSHYFVIYDEIGGLIESNPVEVSGYKVGVVQTIDFIDDGTGRLLVTLSLDKKMKIPEGSLAEITNASLIAGMKIQFIFSDSQTSYSSGDTIGGRLAVPITTRLENELLPLKATIELTVSRIDSIMIALNNTLTPGMTRDLQETTSNVKSITGTMARSLSGSEDEIKMAIANLSSFSRVLAQNAGMLDSTMKNLAEISDSIASADLTGTLNRLGNAAAETATLLEAMNDGKGSAGKLITNDSLYNNLNTSLENLSILLEDLKNNPKRYVHFSLFGKK